MVLREGSPARRRSPAARRQQSDCRHPCLSILGNAGREVRQGRGREPPSTPALPRATGRCAILVVKPSKNRIRLACRVRTAAGVGAGTSSNSAAHRVGVLAARSAISPQRPLPRFRPLRGPSAVKMPADPLKLCVASKPQRLGGERAPFQGRSRHPSPATRSHPPLALRRSSVRSGQRCVHAQRIVEDQRPLPHLLCMPRTVERREPHPPGRAKPPRRQRTHLAAREKVIGLAGQLAHAVFAGNRRLGDRGTAWLSSRYRSGRATIRARPPGPPVSRSRCRPAGTDAAGIEQVDQMERRPEEPHRPKPSAAATAPASVPSSTTATGSTLAIQSTIWARLLSGHASVGRGSGSGRRHPPAPPAASA